MHWIDFGIFTAYMLAVFGIGVYFFRKNVDREDYYVGGRKIGHFHIGLSIVATDVGGGFSIGLGGLGFLMGLSGSWLLFTGLLGAWISAVLIIPKIKRIDLKHGMITYPDFLRHRFGNKVALIAAIISGLGYLGFTGGQILAGAKLAAGTIFADIPLDMDPITFALLIIAGVILIYTVLGGLNAVIFTDSIQWTILLSGLIFFAIPFGISGIGGWEAFQSKLEPEYFSLTNVSLVQVINWVVTIAPIWLIAMTLYQRMFACKNVKEAKRAWFVAGIFEYPIMAFTGVFLGMLGRIYFPEVDPEMGLPMVIKDVLPIGIKGIVIAAYFSAIMSTADSCLIASSGNFVNDVIERYFLKTDSHKKLIRISQLATLIIGVITFIIASMFTMVLDVILHAYSFMVAGLTIITLAAYFAKRVYPSSAIVSMIAGGAVDLFLIFSAFETPIGLHPSFYGILTAAIVYYGGSFIERNGKKYGNIPEKSSNN